MVFFRKSDNKTPNIPYSPEFPTVSVSLSWETPTSTRKGERAPSSFGLIHFHCILQCIYSKVPVFQAQIERDGGYLPCNPSVVGGRDREIWALSCIVRPLSNQNQMGGREGGKEKERQKQRPETDRAGDGKTLFLFLLLTDCVTFNESHLLSGVLEHFSLLPVLIFCEQVGKKLKIDGRKCETWLGTRGSLISYNIEHIKQVDNWLPVS